MDHFNAVESLAALAQSVRLAVFRRLVRAGPDGLCPSQLQEEFGLTPSVLSFHLKALRGAGLVSVRQAGRHLYYAADYTAMNALIAYLGENCCADSADTAGDCKEPQTCATS
ncbi:ArsR/SmtB family transcription factor [Algiphilus aromaticivorans]|uniref:ArsR/SmtB family transcription factor n=1 Tax=Algiphilus aromaticivorans TaxID=382454 RepID=UPI0005C24512|nr:metalloregulator ArsR/SmtB family transcription factor [Algiphilus aromaticivorans]